MSGGGRTLNDDFDDDDLAGGSLDLEKGSAQVGSGVTSSYDGGGIDFDDDLLGDDASAHGALELDIPGGGRSAPPPGVPSSPSRAPGHGPSGGLPVPDLALDPRPPPARPSGSLAAAARPTAPQPAPPSPSSGASAPAPPSDGGAHAASPPASGPRAPQGVYGGAPPPARPTGAAVIAKYPAPPEKIHHAPMYAIRVVLRQLELRSDLESLRRRRSPDVPLYEAALGAYEPKTFRLGMALNCAALAIATFIFFLPVIIRFMRD